MPVKITHRARIREVKQAVGGTSQRIRDELKKDLQPYADEHVAQRQRFVATWQGESRRDRFKRNATGEDIPQFKAVIEESEAEVRLRIVLTGSAYGKLKYRWVSGGTQVRYSILSEDWASKTTRANVESSTGDGYTITATKAIRQPGIAARLIDEHLKLLLEPPFLEKIAAKYRNVPMTITSRAGVTRE